MWKQLPGGIDNGVANIAHNAPRFVTDPNMSVGEVSDLTNAILNTGFLAKGTYDMAGKISNFANKAIPRILSAMETASEAARSTSMQPSIPGYGGIGSAYKDVPANGGASTTYASGLNKSIL